MKVIIAGSRDITDISHVHNAFMGCGFSISEVVSGMARGVDTLAIEFAKQIKVPVYGFPANWKKHGKGAGPIRNLEMANYAEALIAIWDGKSRGTEHMIKCAESKGLKVYIHMVKGNNVQD